MFYSGASLKQMQNRKGKPWRGTLQYKDPETHKWRQKTRVFSECRTKSEAKKALVAWQNEMEQKASLQAQGRTVETAVREYLDSQRKLQTISIVTYQNTLRLAETVTFPIIGKEKFIDLDKTKVQDYINKMIEKGYKPSTVRTIFSTVSKTYKDAFRRDEVLHDPTKGVILPRVKQNNINYLNAENRKRFLALMTPTSNFYLPTMIAYYTGLRAGEICALTWRDIDIVKCTIRVNKTAKDYVYKKGIHRVEISEPKTPKSNRVVPIIEPLRTILIEAAQEANPDPSDRVINWKNPRLLCTSFIKWSKRHNLYGEADRPVSMHALRHTFATIGVQSGMDIKSLSSILGHSSTAMTLDTYASDDEQAKVVAMSNIQSFFRVESENDLL